MAARKAFEAHPAWCSPDSCTAYDTELTDLLYHRSDPVVLPTADPRNTIYVYRSTGADGRDDCIELVEFEEPVTDPWYLTEPRDKHAAELIMTVGLANRAQSAIAALAMLPDTIRPITQRHASQRPAVARKRPVRI